MKTRTEVTGLLQHWAAGDRNALDRLIPLVYDELMRLARRHLHGERPDHTLSSAALVHEAYLRLVDVDRASFESRAHFLAMASRAMRRLLVDHARQRTAQKRGGGARALALDDALQLADKDASCFLELHDALGRLESAHARRATALEQYYFGGLTPDEIAEVLSVSRSTVERDLRFGRAWLATQLSPTPNPS